jgi:cysteine-rich repeat protein
MCGNGSLECGLYETGYRCEECDDGNLVDEDGCSAACTQDPGWICPTPGAPCRVPTCGDGFVDSWYDATNTFQSEECDDGNALSDDGCSAACTVESGWVCDNPGASCRPVVCGDGYVDGWTDADGNMVWEDCDDGNTATGDGCSDSCMTEAGWSCWYWDGCRRAVCGDGIWDCYSDGNGNFECETCEDGNQQPGDGCSASCALEPGFNCDSGSCHRVVCGDGMTECTVDGQGAFICEMCDDGNAVARDGCTNCQPDPGYGTGGTTGTGGTGFVGSGGTSPAGGATLVGSGGLAQ